jgi:DNA sulfur modification protein DndC
LDIEQRHRAQVRRAGLFDSLEKAMRRGFYDDVEDATQRAQRRKSALERAPETHDDEPDPLDVADGYVRAVAEPLA